MKSLGQVACESAQIPTIAMRCFHAATQVRPGLLVPCYLQIAFAEAKETVRKIGVWWFACEVSLL